MAWHSFASVHNGLFRMIAAELTHVGPRGEAEQSMAHRRARDPMARPRAHRRDIRCLARAVVWATRIMARAGCARTVQVACHVLMLPSVRHVPCMPRMCTHFGCVRGSCSCTGRAGRTRRHGPLHAASGGRQHTAPCRPIPCRMVSNTAWNSTSIGIPHSLHSLVGGGGQGAHSILQASHRKSHPRSSS